MLTSILRTVVPVIVGWLVSLPVLDALDLEQQEAALTALISALITIGYYIVIRIAETKVDRRAGWLLGKASPPVYPQG